MSTAEVNELYGAVLFDKPESEGNLLAALCSHKIHTSPNCFLFPRHNKIAQQQCQIPSECLTQILLGLAVSRNELLPPSSGLKEANSKAPPVGNFRVLAL